MSLQSEATVSMRASTPLVPMRLVPGSVSLGSSMPAGMAVPVPVCVGAQLTSSMPSTPLAPAPAGARALVEEDVSPSRAAAPLMTPPHAGRPGLLPFGSTDPSSVQAPPQLMPEMHLSGALAVDGRLDPKDRLYLSGFFEDLGVRIVADLQDIEALEPLSTYFRSSLEAYEAKGSRAGGAVRAALGRLVRAVSKEGRRPEPAEPADSAPESTPDSTPMQGSAAGCDDGAAIPDCGADSAGSGDEPKQLSLSKNFLDHAAGMETPVSAGGDAVIVYEGSPRKSVSHGYASLEALDSPSRHPRARRHSSPQPGSRGRPSITVAPTAAAAHASQAPHSNNGSIAGDSSLSNSPRKARASSPRPYSPTGKYPLESGFGHTSPSWSKKASFSQAGSKAGICRDTAWSKTGTEGEPARTMLYRPNIKSWEDHRSASPRATIGTARRQELFGAANDTCAGAFGEAAKEKVISSITGRFSFGSSSPR